MLSRDPQFVQVKAAGAGLGGRTTYWLGPDHLLVVTATYFAESYRRFYYAEIGAVVVRRTETRTRLMAGAGAALAVLGLWEFVLVLGATWTENEMAGAVFLGVMVALALGILVGEWIGGPTCTCRVYTAVQAGALPGVRRWNKAERLLQVLTPRIIAAQGGGGSVRPADESLAAPTPDAVGAVPPGDPSPNADESPNP